MKKLILCLFMLAGCTHSQVVCNLESVAVSAMTPLVASALQCSNSSAISASFTSWFNAGGLCSNSQINQLASVSSGQKVKLDAVTCGIIVNLLLGAANGTIPATWGCSASSGLLSSALTTACQAI